MVSPQKTEFSLLLIVPHLGEVRFAVTLRSFSPPEAQNADY